MKGDPLPWQGTSRCITKPHSLVMASVSFSYTGKHLLIFVTAALHPSKSSQSHLGTQICLLFKLFLPESCFILEHDCVVTYTPHCTTTYCCTSRAVCQHAPIANNLTDPHGRFFCKGNNAISGSDVAGHWEDGKGDFCFASAELE